MKSGEVIQGKYRLDKRLGIGGMGEVWRATHTGTGRDFAVKFMHAHVATSSVARDRFAREARASAQINHPSIIDIFDVGEHDESLYLVMELLTGMLLVDALAGEPRLTIRDFLAVMHDVAEALGAAHAAGIVHRDIKPENIFLHLDRISGISLPKVLDFGIGKFADGGGVNATDTGATLGSPRYMSPEQSRSATNVDGRADIWSCGVILFEALTGTFPHDGDSFSSLIISICTSPPESIDALAPTLPESVRSIVRDCLQPIDTRIASAADLAARLTIAIEDPAIAGVLLARQLHGDGPASNTEGMRFREIAPGPLSMAMPSRAVTSAPVSSNRLSGPAIIMPASLTGPALKPGAAPFKAVARTMPITAEDRARLSAYMDSANKAGGAGFVPTAHTAKVDPAILAEAARVLEAKRARAAAASSLALPPSLQPQSSQPQPLQPQSLQPQSSQPQPSPPEPLTPVPGTPKPPPIAPQPTLRSQVDPPADPASAPVPELARVPDLEPAPIAAVADEPAVIAPPPPPSRALPIVAAVLALALGGVLAALVATMRAPAPVAPPVPSATVAPAVSMTPEPMPSAAAPEPVLSAAPTASASVAPAASAAPSASSPTGHAAPWPSSHYRALSSGSSAPGAPPAP
ncbi:MAG: serine/threonine-protein kinase [Byssovorax sp.]